MALLRLFMLTFSVLIWTGLNAVQASERITGFDIKAQAKSVVTSSGTSLDLMVSDKRTFFKCGEQLSYKKCRKSPAAFEVHQYIAKNQYCE